MKSRKGQVWVETVVYTLIAFAIIGLVLSFVRPEIEKSQDKSIIQQSIGIMESIDEKILNIKNIPGNKRELELSIREGSLTIDGIEDKIFFEMESQHKYSEPGTPIKEGDLTVFTREKGDLYLVNITRNYTNYDLTYAGSDEVKKIQSAPSAYKLVISNEKEEDGKIVMDFDLN